MEKKPLSNVEGRAYVYIYRDEKSGKIFYVGRGGSASRATSHEAKTHNKGLESRLTDKKKKWRVEIGGPFPTKTADAVETALVSALKGADPTLFNVHLCSTESRFRPLGVPSRLVGRLDDGCISKKELEVIAKEGAILVHINPDMEITDREFSMANLPDDKTLLERLDRWWRMAGLAANWAKNPDQSPRWLLGISGTPKSQFVIGCIRIDQNGWAKTETHKGVRTVVAIPTVRPKAPNLDEHGFRGRKLDPKLGIKFTQQSYIAPEKFREMFKNKIPT
jgi:hypothetical protein